jgi:hypothetical protein
VAIHGQMPDFFVLAIYSVVSQFVMSLGYWVFIRTRKGFADVL